MARARTPVWLIVLGVIVALGALVLALVGPWTLRHLIRPIAQVKVSQNEFQKWNASHPFSEPATPPADEARLRVFLALRAELIEWQRKMESLGRQMPQGRRPSLDEVASAVEGMTGMVGSHSELYRKHEMTLAEYNYWRRLVYDTWLPALVKDGADPAARDRAAKEIEAAAQAEKDPAVRSRLAATASSLRARLPAAPDGIPPPLHALLLARAQEIQALDFRGSSGRRSQRSASP